MPVYIYEYDRKIITADRHRMCLIGQDENVIFRINEILNKIEDEAVQYLTV